MSLTLGIHSWIHEGDVGIGRQIQREIRKPARGGLLEVFRRLSETGLNSYLVEPGGSKIYA